MSGSNFHAYAHPCGATALWRYFDNVDDVEGNPNMRVWCASGKVAAVYLAEMEGSPAL